MKADKTQATVLLVQRQQDLGISDVELAGATGYEPAVIAMIKSGTMRLPVNKVPAFAAALKIDTSDLLRAVLLESAPGLWEVIEQLLPVGQLTETETNLITHLRKLSGDRKAVPIVLDGRAVIALVAAA